MWHLIVIMFFCLELTAAYGAENKTHEQYKINKKVINFIYDRDAKILADENCFIQKEKCQALQALKIASFKGLEKHFKNGANRGAVACQRRLKGLVMIAYDRNGNEETFCKFKDGSLLASDSIWFHAFENDAKKVP